MSLPLEPRMYVIVREDLSMKYIQGAHALSEFALEHPKEFQEWENRYLIFLSVFNGLVLDALKIELLSKGVTLSEFFEPDLKSELPTALCLFDDGKNGYRNYLKKLSLASK